MTDIPQANFWFGCIITLSILTTCMYQIWISTKQKELECNAFQLLYWHTIMSAGMLIPIIPVYDNVFGIELPSPCTIFAIGLSSCLSFLVNISIFLVIGKTSPIGYNMLGHFKLTLILSLSMFFLAPPST